MRFARLDHIVLQVPEIQDAHRRLLSLGFEEAWPIGRTWPIGPTSGVALGGINLELLQPDEEPPESAALAELVFSPDPRTPLERYGRVVEKMESDREKLAARGFPASALDQAQRICTNAFPGAESLWPHFVCDYAPLLAARLSASRFAAPYGFVRTVDVGALRARPRFVPEITRADLQEFLGGVELKTGPELRQGNDRVTFGSGHALVLSELRIEIEEAPSPNR